MDFMKYRVKNMEAFKDGTILGGRFLRPGEILEVSEQDFVKITNSGGILEVLETVIPNPLKSVEPVEVTIARLEQEIAEEETEKAKQAEESGAKEKTYRQEAEDKKVEAAPKKKPGRKPKKVS